MKLSTKASSSTSKKPASLLSASADVVRHWTTDPSAGGTAAQPSGSSKVVSIDSSSKTQINKCLNASGQVRVARIRGFSKATQSSMMKHIKPMAASANTPNSCVGVVSATKKQSNSRLPWSAKKTSVLLKRSPKPPLDETQTEVHKSKPDLIDQMSSSSSRGKEDPITKVEKISDRPEESVGSNHPTFTLEKTQSWSSLTKSDDYSLEVHSKPHTQIKSSHGSNQEDSRHSDVEMSHHVADAEQFEPHPKTVTLKALSENNSNAETSHHVTLCVNRPSSPLKDLQQECNEHVLLHPLKEVDTLEPKTPIVTHKKDSSNCQSVGKCSTRMKEALVQDYLQFFNSATMDELRGIHDIGEKRATIIIEPRKKSPEPYKSLDDLQEIGLSLKQVKSMMKNVTNKIDLSNCQSGTFSSSSRMKVALVQDYLQFLNSATKAELKGIKRIGEKRATLILDRQKSKPFKSLDDLQEIGLSANQVETMIKSVAMDIFS